MNREGVRRLLGGYAAGNLTEEERKALCEAAVDDQEIFDALAREDVLREALEDPAARGRLLAALGEPKHAWYKRWIPVAMAAAVAGLVLAIVWQRQEERTRPTIAQLIVRPVPEAMPLPQSLPVPPPAVPARPKAQAVEAREPAPAPPPRSPQAAPAAAPAPAPPPVEALAPRLGIPPSAGLAAGLGGGAGAAPSARALFYAPTPAGSRLLGAAKQRESIAVTASIAVPAGALHLGVRYTLLKKLPDGSAVEADPQTEFAPGEEVSIRFAANDAVFLSVLRRAGGSWDVVTRDQRIDRLASFIVPQSGAFTSAQPGSVELFVIASRSPVGDPIAAMVRAGGDQARETTASDRSTYVVSMAADPAAQRIGFPVTLRYR